MSYKTSSIIRSRLLILSKTLICIILHESHCLSLFEISGTSSVTTVRSHRGHFNLNLHSHLPLPDNNRRRIIVPIFIPVCQRYDHRQRSRISSITIMSMSILTLPTAGEEGGEDNPDNDIHKDRRPYEQRTTKPRAARRVNQSFQHLYRHAGTTFDDRSLSLLLGRDHGGSKPTDDPPPSHRQPRST